MDTPRSLVRGRIPLANDMPVRVSGVVLSVFTGWRRRATVSGSCGPV